MTLITSPHNPRVKAAAKLRQRKGRTRQDRILIDGVRETLRALQSGVLLHEVFVCQSCSGHADWPELERRLSERGTALWRVADPVFAKLSYGDRHDGVLAVAQPPEWSLDRLQLPDNPLVVVLEGIEKPGNLGAVARTADATGAAAILLADDRVDPFNPNAIRSSVGTVFRVPVVCDSSSRLRGWLSAGMLQIVTAQVDAARLYSEVDYRGPTALVLGSEARGLSAEWEGAEVIPVRLPMRGIGDSLNVSVTAGVMLYEALRQRLQTKAPK